MPTLTQTYGAAIKLTRTATHTYGATVSKRRSHTYGAWLTEPEVVVSNEESMTEAERDALVAVQPGTIIYNTDADEYQIWNGSTWVSLGTTTPGEIPDDGADGTVLTKQSAEDYDIDWEALPSGAVTFYKSGAGVTITDGDFPSTPANGTLAVTYNTTTSRGYLWARTNGVWKSVQVT